MTSAWTLHSNSVKPWGPQTLGESVNPCRLILYKFHEDLTEKTVENQSKRPLQGRTWGGQQELCARSTECKPQNEQRKGTAKQNKRKHCYPWNRWNLTICGDSNGKILSRGNCVNKRSAQNYSWKKGIKTDRGTPLRPRDLVRAWDQDKIRTIEKKCSSMHYSHVNKAWVTGNDRIPRRATREQQDQVKRPFLRQSESRRLRDESWEDVTLAKQLPSWVSLQGFEAIVARRFSTATTNFTASLTPNYIDSAEEKASPFQASKFYLSLYCLMQDSQLLSKNRRHNNSQEKHTLWNKAIIRVGLIWYRCGNYLIEDLNWLWPIR